MAFKDGQKEPFAAVLQRPAILIKRPSSQILFEEFCKYVQNSSKQLLLTGPDLMLLFMGRQKKKVLTYSFSAITLIL